MTGLDLGRIQALARDAHFGQTDKLAKQGKVPCVQPDGDQGIFDNEPNVVTQLARRAVGITTASRFVDRKRFPCRTSRLLAGLLSQWNFPPK